jgi:glucose-6-phosphate 1-epimerase
MEKTSQIDELNRRFGITGVAAVVAGNNGLPKVSVTTAQASAEIYLHGAQVTSWQPAGAEEVIFLSEHSYFQDGRAIRGGIPICAPWFGPKADDPKAPSHGFVRIKEWRLDSVSAEDDGAVAVTLSTESNEASRRWWPHELRMVHRIVIGKTLHLELTVTNTGAAAFEFAEALHTYFRVGDARTVRVRGVDGVTFQDNADGNREKVQRGELMFAGPTDNVYLNTQGPIELVDPTLRRTIRTEKRNSATTVVWNPGPQGAAALADLGDDEWQRMVCVEVSNVRSAAVSLGPGQTHTMTSILSVDAGECAVPEGRSRL